MPLPQTSLHALSFPRYICDVADDGTAEPCFHRDEVVSLMWEDRGFATMWERRDFSTIEMDVEEDVDCRMRAAVDVVSDSADRRGSVALTSNEECTPISPW